MKIYFNNMTGQKKWDHYRPKIKEVFRKTCSHFSLSDKSEIGCVLVGEPMMHEYNRNYRGIDRSTDVLTFVDDDQPDYLGDIIINVDAVVSQAKEYHHTLTREICFLFAHGLLHTLGYDHQTSEEEKTMIAIQKEILSHVPKRRHNSSDT